MASSSSPTEFTPPPMPDNLAESETPLGKYDRHFKDKTVLQTMLGEWLGELKPWTQEFCKKDCLQKQGRYMSHDPVRCLYHCFEKYELGDMMRARKAKMNNYAKWRLCVAQHLPQIDWDIFYKCERQFSYQQQKDEDDLVEEVYNHCETILRRFNH